MELTITTDKLIPNEDHKTIIKQFMQITGVTKVEVLAHSIRVAIPIKTTDVMGIG